MRKSHTFIVLALLSISASFAGVEAVVQNNYVDVGDDLIVHVDINESFSGAADLKFCLANFDFASLSYNYRCDIFLSRFDIEFDHTYSEDYSLPLIGVQPLIYRLFVQLHFNDTYHKDSDSNNFVYMAAATEPAVYVYSPSGVVVDARSVKKTAELGETVSNTFNITNFENCTNLKLYSFIYDYNKSITGKWNTNMQELVLPYGSVAQVTLNNTVDYNASIGSYYYDFRVYACGENFDFEQQISIVPKLLVFHNVTVEDDGLIIKNYEQTNASYALEVVEENKTYLINGSLMPHTQEKIALTNGDKFVKVYLNGRLSEELFLLNNTKQVVYVTKEVFIESNATSPVTGFSVLIEEKSFYTLSLLTSISALVIMYVKLK